MRPITTPPIHPGPPPPRPEPPSLPFRIIGGWAVIGLVAVVTVMIVLATGEPTDCEACPGPALGAILVGMLLGPQVMAILVGTLVPVLLLRRFALRPWVARLQLAMALLLPLLLGGLLALAWFSP